MSPAVRALWAAQGACGAVVLSALATGSAVASGELRGAVRHVTGIPIAVATGAYMGAVGVPVTGMFCPGARILQWAWRRGRRSSAWRRA